MINVTKTDLPDLESLLPYLRRIWESNWVTNDGELVRLLEERLAERLRVSEVVAVSSGTAALHLAMRSLGLSGSVVTTPFTFATTTNLISWEGLRPVFADIEPGFLCIDPADVERKIADDTSAIIAVHVYGNPCDVEGLAAVARRNGLKLIYDAAQAFGVEYKDRSVLEYGDASALSFHATKVFNTMEGGAVCPGDAEIAGEIRSMRNHGILSEVRVGAPGINAKMSEILAAVGLCNLDEVDQKIEARKAIYESYLERLAPLDEVSFQVLRAGRYNYSYMPVLFRDAALRDAVHDALLARGVKSRKYFYPITPCFDYLEDDCPDPAAGVPVAADAALRVLCLPIYPDLDRVDFERIVETVSRVVLGG